jgi:hypothetical protein
MGAVLCGAADADGHRRDGDNVSRSIAAGEVRASRACACQLHAVLR